MKTPISTKYPPKILVNVDVEDTLMKLKGNAYHAIIYVQHAQKMQIIVMNVHIPKK
jgi:hypothetical protein